MGKSLLYTTLGLIVLMGTLTIGVVNAEITISHYTGNNISYTLNENELFTGVGTITITDGTDTITILDRNLGATKAGTGCDYITNGGYCPYDETYGYHFQWGNNYGFKPLCDLSGSTRYCSDTITSNAVFEKVSVFQKGRISGQYHEIFYGKARDNWFFSDRTVHFWGGSGADNTFSLSGNNWKVSNSTRRQGPCPEGFHVPSIGEFNKLQNMLQGNSKWNKETLHNELLIPFAGLRANSATVDDMGSTTHLRSSSPERSFSQHLSQDVYGNLNIEDKYRSYALSLRCFYNLYQPFTQSFTLSFTGSEGGSISTGTIEVDSGSSISRDDEVGSVTVSGSVVATGIADEGYAFSGWLTDCGNIVTTGCSFTGDFKLTTYEIKYELDGGTNSQNNVTGYTIKDSVTFENPTKDNHTFEGRYSDAEFINKVDSIPTGSTGDITLYAKWKENKKSSGGSSGGGGGMKKDNCPNGDLSPSYYDGMCEENNSGEGSGSVSSGTDVKDLEGDKQDSSDKSSEGQTELEQAYQFAFKNSITTMDTIDKANMDGYIKRGHLAKMVVNYVTNVLGREIPSDIPASCLSFNDEATARESEEIKDYAIKSCALGLMGIRMKNNKFLPNDYVTRAEFGTVLSRILRGDKYNLVHTQEKPRYTDHLKALKEEGIMTKIDNPKMLEKRGYVMIMIMRSTQ